MAAVAKVGQKANKHPFHKGPLIIDSTPFNWLNFLKFGTKSCQSEALALFHTCFNNKWAQFGHN